MKRIVEKLDKADGAYICAALFFRYIVPYLSVYSLLGVLIPFMHAGGGIVGLLYIPKSVIFFKYDYPVFSAIIWAAASFIYGVFPRSDRAVKAVLTTFFVCLPGTLSAGFLGVERSESVGEWILAGLTVALAGCIIAFFAALFGRSFYNMFKDEME